MSAKDYSVNFPYGATSAPYSAARPHKGNDRPCPARTPIVIGDTTIGLTGDTGYTFGAHLHIQEWNGSYSNVRKPQNEFKPGTVIGVYPNSKGDGSFGKFIDIQTADGWVDSYCHLSAINVQVGQKVGGSMAEKTNLGTARILAESILGRDRDFTHAGKGDADLNQNHVNVDLSNGYIYNLWTSKEAQAAAAQRATYKANSDKLPGVQADLTKAQAQISDLGKAISIKDNTITSLTKEVESLKAQVGDNSKWETFKALIREIIK